MTCVLDYAAAERAAKSSKVYRGTNFAEPEEISGVTMLTRKQIKKNSVYNKDNAQRRRKE